MNAWGVQRVAFVILLFFSTQSLSWTLDEKNFTQSTSFILDITPIEVPCWYPISGTYGRLPRILFYCTITFGLLASQFEWLIAGALAAALTYSGSAAVHACVLVWRGPTYGELDLYPLLAILSTSCLITIPLINWSQTLRKLGSRDGDDSGARAIVVYWGALVLIGLITILVTFWNQTYYGSNYSTLDRLTCNPPNFQMNYTAGQDQSFRHFTVNAEWIHENGCADPCQQSSFLWPPAIFRSYSDLQSLSKAELGTLNAYLAEPATALGAVLSFPPTVTGFFKFFAAYGYFGTVIGSFVLFQGIWALCFGRKSPHQARDIIYSFIASRRIGFRSRHSKTDDAVKRSFLKRAAKYIATLAYFCAVISTVLSVLMFLGNIVIMELVLAYFPQSESAIHIGAWSSWASTGLIVSALFMGKFDGRLVRSGYEAIQRAFNRVGYWAEGKKQVRHDKRYNHQASQQPLSKRATPAQTARYNGWAPYHRALRILKWVSKRLSGMGHDLKLEWRLLKAFWRDPENAINDSPRSQQHFDLV